MNSTLTNPKSVPGEILDVMQNVISDIDAFLTQWLDRSTELAELAAHPDEHLQRRIQELRSEQQQWENQRIAQQQVLEAKAEQLTDAWLRLEAEQRRLLQTGVSNTPAEPNNARLGRNLALPDEPNFTREREAPAELNNGLLGPSLDLPAEPSPHREGEVPAEPNNVRPGPSLAHPVEPPREIIPRDAAVSQFEKLKNAIEASRRNIEKSST